MTIVTLKLYSIHQNGELHLSYAGDRAGDDRTVAVHPDGRAELVIYADTGDVIRTPVALADVLRDVLTRAATRRRHATGKRRIPRTR